MRSDIAASAIETICAITGIGGLLAKPEALYYQLPEAAMLSDWKERTRMGKRKSKRSKSIRQHPVTRTLSALAAIGGIKMVGLLPYHRRVPLSGWIMRAIAAPLLGYRTRINNNLSMIFPHMRLSDRLELTRKVSDHMGRTFIEILSPDDLLQVVDETEMAGEGVPFLKEAQEKDQPIIFVSGHIGNYDVWRASLIQSGIRVGALYRDMNNPRFNAYYVSKISKTGRPLFARDRGGLTEMVTFLRQGNAIAILTDQHVIDGAPLTFMGRTANTALSAAELALKHGALLIPIYAIRQPDGLSFEITLESPIQHSEPLEMTQKLNDSLEAQVRLHPEQWFWVHRRWKAQNLGK